MPPSQAARHSTPGQQSSALSDNPPQHGSITQGQAGEAPSPDSPRSSVETLWPLSDSALFLSPPVLPHTSLSATSTPAFSQGTSYFAFSGPADIYPINGQPPATTPGRLMGLDSETLLGHVFPTTIDPAYHIDPCLYRTNAAWLAPQPLWIAPYYSFRLPILDTPCGYRFDTRHAGNNGGSGVASGVSLDLS